LLLVFLDNQLSQCLNLLSYWNAKETHGIALETPTQTSLAVWTNSCLFVCFLLILINLPIYLSPAICQLQINRGKFVELSFIPWSIFVFRLAQKWLGAIRLSETKENSEFSKFSKHSFTEKLVKE